MAKIKSFIIYIDSTFIIDIIVSIMIIGYILTGDIALILVVLH